MTTQHITIIGGGVIGLTLANLLAPSEYSITLIDQGHPPSTGLKTPYDLRVAAINHASEHIFQQINVWESIKHLRTSPYEKMHVWDANSPAQLTFHCAEVGKNHLGHIIEYSVLKQALYQQLLTHKNVHLCYETKPVAIQEIQQGLVVSLGNGEFLQTQLLIGADGGDSWVARQAGFSNPPRPYHQSALVTTLKTEKAHKKTAWQRFLDTGPLAFLPLVDPHHVSIVWSTQPNQANHLAATLSETAFNDAVAQAFDHQLGNVEVLDQRIVFPLIERHAARYVQSRIALVGDAAHTIHPLAGLGMNLGLQDAASLAQLLTNSAGKKDPGNLGLLRQYERSRKGENAMVVKAMRGFQQVFGSTSSVLTHARYLGFALTESVPFVKRFFMERAMGL